MKTAGLLLLLCGVTAMTGFLAGAYLSGRTQLCSLQTATNVVAVAKAYVGGSADAAALSKLTTVPGLEAVAGAFYMPAATGKPSDAWRPMIFRHCLPGMPPEWGPCLKARFPNLEVGEEVVYPDFKLHLPRTIRPDQMPALLDAINVHPPPWQDDKAYAHYGNQHGRNLRFANVTYHNSVPIDWPVEGTCMTTDPVSLERFVATAATPGVPVYDDVMFAASPDAWSFQHFIDRVNHLLQATRHLRKNSTVYLTQQMRSEDRFVQQFWPVASGNPSPVRIHHSKQIWAKSFLMACDTPLVHPFLLWRVHETLIEHVGADIAGVPAEQRKVIATMPRTDGSERNGGRRWLNYGECEPQMQALLDRRGKGEVVKRFLPAEHSDERKRIRFFHDEVRAIVGMHGGGLYHTMWLSPGTSVIEIRPQRPSARPLGGKLFWEMANVRNLSYWSIVQPTTNDRGDSEVNCTLVVDTLAAALDETPSMQPAALDRWYQGFTYSELSGGGVGHWG